MASLGSMSAPSLMEEAAAAFGGDDWGDLHFVQALELLLEARQRMTPFGAGVLRRVAVRRLTNRLYLRAYVRQHPEAPERPLTATAVVTGLPRTGTTVLHNLLAQDPAHRVLRLWEALHPVPPEREGRFSRARLVAQAERWLARMYELVPTFPAIHPATAEGPEECDVLLQNDFASQHFDDMFDSPAYSAWLYRADLGAEYSHYGLQLRVLSAGDATATWALKSPSHLAHLEALSATLPDATIVWCHRRPVEAVASWASLIRAVRTPYCGAVAPEVVGGQALERATAATARALDARDRMGPGRFVDVPFRLVRRDAVAAVRLVYERAGRPLSPPVEEAMRRWLEVNPQHGQGVHRYRAAEFGLAAGEVEERFAPYLARFGDLVE